MVVLRFEPKITQPAEIARVCQKFFQRWEVVIDKIGRSADDPIVVNVGKMRVTVLLADLRLS